jgi:hypothetical protein
MAMIRLRNASELKIEEPMQVKGRQRRQERHEGSDGITNLDRYTAAQSMGIAESLGARTPIWERAQA